MYLLIAQQMGVVGLTMFMITIGAVLLGAVRTWPAVSRTSPERAAFFLGAHGALVGALFSGIFDHYFFNIDFHNSVMLLCLLIGMAVSSQQGDTAPAEAQPMPRAGTPKYHLGRGDNFYGRA
jgi:O-antigen ligase